MLDDLQPMLKANARVFFSQSFGIVGLFWCLFDGHPDLGVLLTLLVLADQAVFLYGRVPRERGIRSLQAALDLWCGLVSVFDVVMLFAVLFRAYELRDGAGAAVSDPLDALSFSVSTFFRLGSDLLPGSPVSRLLASGEALLGSGFLIAVAILIGISIADHLQTRFGRAD